MGSMMNNFQMLGQGMGAFGGAAFAVAGGIGSVVIPKLLEGGTAFEKIGEEIKETTARLDKFIERENRMTDFEAKLGKVDTRRGLREAGEHNALDIKKKDDELQIVKDRYQQLAFERQKLGASRNATGAGQNFLESWSSPTKLLGMATSSIMGIDGAIKIVDDDMKKMLTHILDSAADLAQLRKQEEAIEAAGGRVDSRNFDILKGLESDRPDWDPVLMMRSRECHTLTRKWPSRDRRRSLSSSSRWRIPFDRHSRRPSAILHASQNSKAVTSSTMTCFRRAAGRW